METDEQSPEMDLAPGLVKHVPSDLRPPIVEPGEHREDHCAEQHIVEMGYHEVGVRHVEVHRRASEHDTSETAEQEGRQEADSKEHRRVKAQRATPHGANPVEELHTSRNSDREGHEGEERQGDRASHEHVVGPHRHRQTTNSQGREHQADIAKHRLATEHWQHLSDDAKERQGDDVHLRVPEEPEEVLPQDRATVRSVEDMGPQSPISLEDEQTSRQDWEDDQHHDRGDEDIPGENRHPEHRHAGGTHENDRRHEVDSTEDGRQAKEVQAHHPQVPADSR